MATNVDILNLDNKIKDYFKTLHNQVDSKQEKYDTLVEFKNSLSDDDDNFLIIDKYCSELNDEIEEKTQENRFNYYVMDTFQILQDYHKILKKPIKVSFTYSKPVDDNKKKELVKKYLKMASKYVNLDNFIDPPLKKTKKDKKNKTLIVCKNCNNRDDFEIIENNIHICLLCSSEQVVPSYSSSYKDSDRINISSKYTYDRRIHFRDQIKCLQAKENSTIDQAVFDDLEDQFKKHFLLEGNENTPKQERYKRISKQTILLFLKDLGYTKYYENINLIHYRITGNKPDDISHLEEKLLEDFDKLTELYDVMFKHLKRKNFINTKNILYQLLKRHKHPVNESDFTFLKTVDRQLFHDDVSKQLFTKLGWNWSSLNF